MRRTQTSGRSTIARSSAAAAGSPGAQPITTEDRAFQLLGLQVDRRKPERDSQRRPHAGGRTAARRRVVADCRHCSSDAYATGQALVALVESGAITTADPAYKRGAQFLLQPQLADGSWFVSTRAHPDSAALRVRLPPRLATSSSPPRRPTGPRWRSHLGVDSDSSTKAFVDIYE